MVVGLNIEEEWVEVTNPKMINNYNIYGKNKLHRNDRKL